MWHIAGKPLNRLGGGEVKVKLQVPTAFILGCMIAKTVLFVVEMRIFNVITESLNCSSLVIRKSVHMAEKTQAMMMIMITIKSSFYVFINQSTHCRTALEKISWERNYLSFMEPE
jgi:hypothetical protein